MQLSDDLDSFAAALKEVSATPASEASAGDVASGALEFILESLGSYSQEQIATLYEHVLGEIANRGLEEEITGEVPDAANISLDEEMNEMIKLVRKMRSNLSRQTAIGKTVSNREIRETLGACASVMKQLMGHQKAVRTFERQRVLENTLVEVLGTISQDKQQEFQGLFRERLEELSQ